MKRLLFTFGAGILPALILMFGAQTSQATSVATWNLNPVNDSWETDANWTPAEAPVSGGLAIFESSNVTNIFLKEKGRTFVHGITFREGASAFTIDTFKSLLVIQDGVIKNNSSVTQNFVAHGLVLQGHATAGDHVSYHVTGGMRFLRGASADLATFAIDPGASIFFGNRTTADNGIFTNSGRILLHGAHAANATFTNNGGEIGVTKRSSGDSALFVNNGGTVAGAAGGRTEFRTSATAANSTLIANPGVNGGAGGSISIRNGGKGGSARVEVFGNGNLDVSENSNFPDVTVGSIEGTGMIFLGAATLHVGSSGLNTVFSGVIRDQGGMLNVNGGSLSKEGTSILLLTNANRYTGGTRVSNGFLFVNNRTGSATGFGPVQVDAGGLGGAGIIAGAVTLGTGNGSGVLLIPVGRREGRIGTLTIENTLNFNPDATYEFDLNSRKAEGDQVVANGVTITGATFSFTDITRGKLAQGTVFTVINNTSENPIAGTFNNLVDGSTFTSKGNTFLVNYEGGDGNDLTLTVQ